MQYRHALGALAVLTAAMTGSAAFAQSNVTLYGIADAAMGKVAGGKFGMISGSGLMANTSSRVGVRGTEDLGGGLKAGFQLETGINLKDGAQQSIGPTFWGRQSHMWLAGGWGTFDMGRTFAPTFSAISAWELTSMANYSPVRKTYADIGASRNSNQFSYSTPNFSGLSATGGYILKNDNGGKAKWDINVIYRQGPLTASLGVNKQQTEKTGYVVGGRYNFGNYALVASYSDNHGKRAGLSIGGQMRMNAWTLTADLVRDTKNNAGPKKYTNALLEAKYALSKRTFMYAAYLRLDGGNNYGLGLRHNF